MFWAEFTSLIELKDTPLVWYFYRLFGDSKASLSVCYIWKTAQKTSQRWLKGFFLIFFASQQSGLNVDLKESLSKQAKNKASSRRLGKTYFRRRKDAFVSAGLLTLRKFEVSEPLSYCDVPKLNSSIDGLIKFNNGFFSSIWNQRGILFENLSIKLRLLNFESR